MRPCTAVATALALVLVGCHPGPAGFSPQDETAVKAVAESAASYLGSGKLEAWADLFSNDVTLHPPHAPAIQGRPALLAWIKSVPKVNGIAFTDVQVRGVGDVAYGTSGFWIAQQGMPADTGYLRGPAGIIVALAEELF